MERERRSREYWEKELSEYWDSGLTVQEYSELKELLDHFFIFQKNSLHLKLANFSSLKRRSKFSFSKNSP